MARPTSSGRRNFSRPPRVNPDMGLLLLPFTLAFSLVFGLVFVLPFMLLRAVLRLLAVLFVLPIILIVTFVAVLVAGLALTFAILAPLAPLVIIALLVYALMRRSPAATAHPG